MGSLLNGLFSRRNASQAPRSRRRVDAERQVERLENRLAMAITVYETVPGAAVITSNDGDDVFIQQVATNPQSVFVADNGSFTPNSNFHVLQGVNTNLTTLYATNGTDVSVTGVLPDEQSDGTVTSFLLNHSGTRTIFSSIGFPVQGSLSYAGNTWSYSYDGSTPTIQFSLVSAGSISDPNIVRPLSGTLVQLAGGATLPAALVGSGITDSIVVRWSAPPVSAGTTVASPTLSAQYWQEYFTGNNIAGNYRTKSNILPSATLSNFTGADFSLPVTNANPGGIVPGTLSGTVFVEGVPVAFRTNSLFAPLGSRTVDLSFGGSAIGMAYTFPDAVQPRRIYMTGTVNLDTGVVHLDFFRDAAAVIRQSPGRVTISANYATYDQDARPMAFTVAPGQDFSREIFAQMLTPGSSINVESPILQPANLAANGLGLNGVTLSASNVNINAQVRSTNYFDVGFNHGVTFDADDSATVEPASAQAIIAPDGTIAAIGIPLGGGGQGYDDDPANAPLVTFAGGGLGRGIVRNGVVVAWQVMQSGFGYTSIPAASVSPPPTSDAQGRPRIQQLAAGVPEQLNFNAAVAAGSYSIVVADDPGTVSVNRGRLAVSPNGSLSGALAATPAAITTPSTSTFIVADTSDLVVEGAIFATSQTYLMQSPATAQDRLPFSFTTVSPTTGVSTGLIRGTTVAVTLGNAMPSPEQGSVASSTVNLQTQVGSMRIKAATPAGDPLAGPLPYDLTINERDDISFDAVAASSRAIAIAAGGNIAFTSALATAGDLAINAGNTFTVSAPLSSSRGQIQITGTSVAVNNSLRVLDPQQDVTRDDIVLTATGGSLDLSGAVSGVNNIRLVQRNRAGTAGRIGGATRIVARGVNVEAEGSVDIRTDAVTFEGRSAGNLSLDELDDIKVTSLRSPGFVTLLAGGADPGFDNPLSPNEVALDATLTDVVGLSVSAPRGSVRVINNVAQSTTLGDPARIAAGTAPSMQAAGEVIIRALATSVTVADAPVGGGSAVPVRVATSTALAGTYAYNSPGTFASTITGARSPLVIDGIALRVGDRVLVKNQPVGRERENGVYVVTNVGSTATSWRLARAADADTSAELPAGSFIRVTEGTGAGRVFSIDYSTVDNVSPIAVTTVANRYGTTLVRAATTGAIPGVYSAVSTTITGAAPGALPAIDGISLAVGDLILVRAGDSSGNAAANGVYEVTSTGGVGSQWVLTRAVDPDSGQPYTAGYVATTEGSFRASLTGQAFKLAYNSLGIDPLRATVTGNGTGRPLTSIGSESVTSTTTFVVSSTAGTNDAAGSLGKMISLRNSVAAAPGSQNPGEVPGFAFASSLPGLAGAPAGAIRLTQELPLVARAFAIDGANRVALPSGGAATPQIFIDGSRITQTKSGTAASLAAEVNGFAFAGGGVGPRTIANLTVGGFPKGAAVKVDGVADVLVSGMTLGRNESGQRLANQHGVRITGNAARTTVLGGTIVGSTGAGVRVDAGATGYTVVGTTVGAVNQNNAAGVSSAGTGRIGVVPLAATVNGAINAVLTPGGTTIQLPASVPAAAIHAGQSVSGVGIPAGTTIVTAIGNQITISQAMTAAGVTTLALGTPARTVVQENLSGVALVGGTTSMINTTVQRNTFDGILISGGSHAIGTTATPTDGRNQITSNGQFGVRINSPAVAAAQSVVNNVFGQSGLNVLGNVGVNGAVAPASLGYVPRPVVVANRVTANLDSKGNEHLAGGTSGSSGSTGSGRPTAVARPVTSRPYRAR